MERIIIITDLGCLKAFRLAPEDPIDGGAVHAHEIEVPALEEVPQQLHEIVTDQAGRFARGSRVGRMTGMSRGEAHELETELENHLIRSLAQRIEEVVNRVDGSTWILAAPEAICNRLEAALDSGVKEHLAYIERAGLTKLSLEEIEERFGPEG